MDQPQDPNDPESTKHIEDHGKKFVIMAVVALILLIIAGAGFYIYQSSELAKPTSTSTPEVD